MSETKEREMEFRAVLYPKVIKAVVKAVVAAKIKEAVMSYRAGGLMISAMDTAGLVWIDYTLREHSFREFSAQSEQIFRVDLDGLNKALRHIDSDGYLTITHDTTRDRLGLSAFGSMGMRKTYEFPVIATARPSDVPREDSDVAFSLDPLAFLEVTKSTAWMTDTLIFIAEKGDGGSEIDRISIYAGKNDAASSQIALIAQRLDVQAPSRGQYASRHIRPISDLAKCARSLDVEFGNGNFLGIQYSLAMVLGEKIYGMGILTARFAPQGEVGFKSFVPDPAQSDLLSMIQEPEEPSEGDAEEELEGGVVSGG